jgi:hypothetical protein
LVVVAQIATTHSISKALTNPLYELVLSYG